MAWIASTSAVVLNGRHDCVRRHHQTVSSCSRIEILESSSMAICRWMPTSATSPACALSISVSCDSSVVHSRWILHTFWYPCVHTQQAGLLQLRPVRWIRCQSADAVATVCPKSSRSSCTRAAWPCFSLSSTTCYMVELSTASHIQVALAHLQVLVDLSRLCVPSQVVLGSVRLMTTSLSCLERTVTFGS